MYKIPNTSKGITLVALVITIIIMLILAGVAINMAIDSDGLFGKANEAVTKWNSAVAEEERIMQNILEQMNEINEGSSSGEGTGSEGDGSEEDSNGEAEQASISLDRTSLALEIVDGVNVTETLVATKNNLEGTITWTSSVPSVATVDGNGKITTVGAGETIITASCGGYSSTCSVTVTEKLSEGLISFKIQGYDETFLAPISEFGECDWYTWTESEYNTIGAGDDGGMTDCVIFEVTSAGFQSSCIGIFDGDQPVSIYDEIEPGKEYMTRKGTRGLGAQWTWE